MEVINIDSKLYPDRLKKIKDYPKQLYLEGNLDLLSTNSISIIGSRACSKEGVKYSKSFAKDLVKKGITIISGMALGIDTAAHVGALEENGNTIAVLGCGFDNIYPKENIKLYRDIINKGGLIVSEYPPDCEANSKRFLARNRIISGLSTGILVIEAAYRSGTSSTCRLAKEQGKDIFCIPHSLEDKNGEVPNRLIKNGAKLVTCAKDIIDKYDFKF